MYGADRLITKDTMPAEHVKRLDGLGFVWDPHTAAWEAGYTALAQYKKTRGDVLVPTGHKTPDGFNLGLWVSNQRAAKDTMPAEVSSQ